MKTWMIIVAGLVVLGLGAWWYVGYQGRKQIEVQGKIKSLGLANRIMAARG